jgi:predicted transcriptional regulator
MTEGWFLNKSDSRKTQMIDLFKLHKCLTLDDLSTSLNYSGRSAHRLLKTIGYYSSITHNGKWYTLEFIPAFDHNGIWFYQSIGFSQYRDLNATICHLIDNSSEGLMASDLSTTLSTSCPPVLNRLYKANKIDRVKINRSFVYLSIDRVIKGRQVARLEKTHGLQRPSDTDTITILVEFIRNPYRSCEELASYLNQKRVFCSADKIKSMFVYFGLEKKIPKMPKKSS